MIEDQYRVMVVDDEPAIAEGIADTLTALTGYQYMPYSNSLQALDAFTVQPCSLVLIDLTMPGINGFELMTRIKAMSPITDCIVITAHKSKNVVYNSHHLGATNIFYKPLDIEGLEMAVKECYRKFLIWQDHFREVSFLN